MEYTASGEDGEGEGQGGEGGGGGGGREEEALPTFDVIAAFVDTCLKRLRLRPGKKPLIKAGETQIRRKAGRPRKSDGSGPGGDPGARLGLAGHPGGHQSGPQVRVQQHTAESKERIAECIDEEIVDAPVPYQSQQILGASSELFRTTIDDFVQEQAVKETAEEGGGGHGRSRTPVERPSSGIFGEPVSACKPKEPSAKDTKCERQRCFRGEAVCRGHATRATWMKKSVTRNVASNA